MPVPHSEHIRAEPESGQRGYPPGGAFQLSLQTPTHLQMTKTVPCSIKFGQGKHSIFPRSHGVVRALDPPGSIPDVCVFPEIFVLC